MPLVRRIRRRLPLSLRAAKRRGNLLVKSAETEAEEGVLGTGISAVGEFPQEIPTVAYTPSE